jgi:hypothetical protein
LESHDILFARARIVRGAIAAARAIAPARRCRAQATII